MVALAVGQRVKIPVFLLGAPFPDQVVAMIRFGGRDVSGILGRSEVFDVHERSGFVMGEILKIDGDAVVLKVPRALSASTFTLSGRATVPLAWANDNLRVDTGPS